MAFVAGETTASDPLQSEAAMGSPPAERVPDPQGWVWPGMLGVPSQALALFADLQLGTLANGLWGCKA